MFRLRNDVVATELLILRREHVDLPGGYLEGPGIEWTLKTDAEFDSIAGLKRMVVSHSGDSPIYLSDIARVEDGLADQRTIVHFDQEKTVECSNLLVTQEVDGVVFANWLAGTEDLIRSTHRT